MAQFLYQFLPGNRPDLATNPELWTSRDEKVAADHFQYLSQATNSGRVILAGRSQDGVGPAIVIFEAADEADAREFMEADPFVAEQLFRAELHPFRASLVREGPG